MKFRPGLSLKWIFYLLVVFIFTTFGAIHFMKQAILKDYFSVKDKSMAEAAGLADRLINTVAEQDYMNTDRAKSMEMLASFRSMRIVLSDLKGHIVFDSHPMQVVSGKTLTKNELQVTPRDHAPKLKLWTTRSNEAVYLDVDEARNLQGQFDESSLIYFAPANDDAGKLIGQLMLIEKMETVDKTIAGIRDNVLLFMAIWFVISAAGCYALIVFTVSKPLKKLADSCEQAGQRDFSGRIEINTGDEISLLARKFNTMAYSLEKHISETGERNEGLVHLASELETRNQELNRRQRAIEFDLRLAHKIQQELLPQVYPKIEGIHISAANFQVGEIGGDCFDFYKLAESRLGAFIGDVSGKGISAALVMSMVTILFSQLKEEMTAPSEILGKVNDIMFRHFGSQHSIYLTCFFITIDVIEREIIFSCAGHNPPFLFRPRTGEIAELEAEGFGLGMFSAVTYEEKRMKLESGDKIILYTDGVVDSRNSEGAMFGIDRLMQKVRENPNANSYRLTHFLVEELEEFAGSVPRADDLTLLILDIDFDMKEEV